MMKLIMFLCFQIHLVHWNAKYSNYNEALRKPDGVAIMAIFLQVSSELSFFSNIFILPFCGKDATLKAVYNIKILHKR